MTHFYGISFHVVWAIDFVESNFSAVNVRLVKSGPEADSRLIICRIIGMRSNGLHLSGLELSKILKS